MTAYLEATGLTRVFGGGRLRGNAVTAIADVSFEIHPGEVLAFLGPNGAGKTTTINLLLGFLQATRGSARIFGHPAGDRRARARLGYLPETYAFYGFLTAPQLLHLFGRMHGIEKRERQRRVDELIAAVGLSDARHRPIGQFSRGMRQRFGIAQALINNPDLLILDEPTSGFDPVGRRMVRDLLLDLKQRGTAILLCSHILSEVETLCDRVLIVNQGRVVRNGTLAEVLSAGNEHVLTFRVPVGAATPDLSTLGAMSNTEPGLHRLVMRDEALAQQAIDRVRAAGCAVTGYASVSRTLEDVFIQDVTGRDEAEKGE